MKNICSLGKGGEGKDLVENYKYVITEKKMIEGVLCVVTQIVTLCLYFDMRSFGLT